MRTPDLEIAVDAILSSTGETIVCATPLGLGKPVPLLNALYARAKAASRLRLSIVTALSLEIPRPHGDLERRFLEPFVKRVFAGLSDVRMTIEDVIAEGDRVVVRLTAQAVQSGEFMGMPASGNPYTIPEIHVFRVSDGKVAEHWGQADLMGMMRQLGAMSGQT